MGKNFAIRPFSKLHKQLSRKEAVAVLPAEKKKEKYSEEELFNSAMEDVQAIEAFRSLSCGRSCVSGKPAVPVRHEPEHESRQMLTAIANGTAPINLADTQEYVEWTNPEHARIIKEQLQEGRFSVQATLDLHGCTVPEAEEELDAFLQSAFIKTLRCLKIIHGRGLRSLNGPRIKQAVIRRLLGRYRKRVIAFVSARQCDGGLGALYVLLQKRQA